MESTWTTWIKNIRCGLLAVLFLALFLVFFLSTVIPFWLFRFFVAQMAVRWGGGLYKMLDSSCQIVLRGPIQYEQKTNITVSLKIGGKVQAEKLRDRIRQVFLQSKNKDGTLSYPEFKMYPHYWLGYPFWKSEHSFLLEEHVRFERIANNCKDEERFVHDYQVQLLRTPFQPRKSPWQILCLEGNSNLSYILFKFHHSMCDGQIIYQILMQLTDNHEPVAIGIQGTSWSLARCFNCATFPFRASFQFSKIIMSMGNCGATPWSLQRQEMSQDTRTIVGSKRLLQCRDVKRAAEKYGVSFTAIVMAGIGGGVDRMMRRSKEHVKRQQELITGYPIPHGCHPGSLTNHYSIITLNFPIGELESEARLYKIDEEITRAKNSTFPTAHNFLLRQVPAVLPHFIYTRIDPADTVVLGVNNFPGPRHLVNIQGLPVLDLDFKLLHTTFTSVLIIICSYNGRLKISCNADPKIFPTEETARQLLHEIDKELDALISK